MTASPPSVITHGNVYFKGEDLFSVDNKKLRFLRGNKVAYVFQDPQMSLHPLIKIGDQIVEAIQAHQPISSKDAWGKAIDLLDQVQIPNAAKRAELFPHQLSGGMRQRVVIAMALANEVDLPIADEPTTVLDAIVQAQILMLLRGLQQNRRLAILFINMIFQYCQRFVQMLL